RRRFALHQRPLGANRLASAEGAYGVLEDRIYSPLVTPWALLQQRDGPLQRLVAEVSRPPLQGGGQGRLEVLGPGGGAVASPLVDQGGRVMCLLVAVVLGRGDDAARVTRSSRAAGVRRGACFRVTQGFLSPWRVWPASRAIPW